MTLSVLALAGALAWLATREAGGGTHTTPIPANTGDDGAADEGDGEELGEIAPEEPATPMRAAETRASAPPEPSPAPPAAASLTVEGRVLDLEGEPVAQVEVFASERADAVLATSAFDGGFALELPRQRTRLEARGEGWTTVRAAVIDPARPPAPATVVVARAIELAGRVVDPQGVGVAGARLTVEEDWRGLASFPLPLERAEKRQASAVTKGDGRFHLEAPLLPHAQLVVWYGGHGPARMDLPQRSRDDLLIELEPIATSEEFAPRTEPILFGVVRLQGGEPAVGARVQLVQAHDATDELGRFELVLPGHLEESALVVAMLDGWQPAVRDDFRAVLSLGGARVGPIELTLPGPELAIAGRLELASGHAAVGWQADLLDPTVLDGMSNPAPTLERRGLARYDVDPVRTDGEGRFRIAGLVARDYRVRLWDQKSYVSIEAGPVPAGTRDLVLRVPDDALLARLEGRVLTRDGLPLEGVQVSLRFVLQRSGSGLTWQTPARGFTDAEGRFALEDVPRRGVEVLVSGEGVEALVHEPAGGELPEEPLELRVWRTVHVRFDFSAREPTPDAVRLCDVDGEPLSMTRGSADGSSSMLRLALQEGRSPVVSVSERAATLVLEREQEELERRPVQLVVGEVNTLGP